MPDLEALVAAVERGVREELANLSDPAYPLSLDARLARLIDLSALALRVKKAGWDGMDGCPGLIKAVHDRLQDEARRQRRETKKETTDHEHADA